MKLLDAFWLASWQTQAGSLLLLFGLIVLGLLIADRNGPATWFTPRIVPPRRSQWGREGFGFPPEFDFTPTELAEARERERFKRVMGEVGPTVHGVVEQPRVVRGGRA